MSGPVSAEEEATAALLLARAREAQTTRDYASAREAAQRVVEVYPRAPASSLALRILAESLFHLGAHQEAAATAERYAALFQPADSRAATGRLLAGRGYAAAGDSARALLTLVELPAAAPRPEREQTLELVRELAHRLDAAALERVASALPADRPAAAPVLAEYAVALHFRGETEAARSYAQRVLALEPPERDRRIAEALLEGRIEEVLGAAPLVAALVPQSGAAYLTQFASQVEEGLRLAVSGYRAERRSPLDLQVHHDPANPPAAAALVEALERSGAVALIGPLLVPSLEAAAQARRGVLPIVSPTARTRPQGVEGVYVLMAPDPTAARTIAEYARRAGVDAAAVMYPTTAQARFEAAAFMEAFRAADGRVVLEVPYDSATTTFEALLARVARARPDALFLPLGERDIPIVAPQIAYYGLDTLGIAILGTVAWTDDATLRRVGARSTNGVLAATPLAADSSNPAYLSFLRAYERTYRKTLRSLLPAYGYDAMGLVVGALRDGARTPAEVRRALDATRDFPGATGAISVEGGRIVRRHVIVRLEDGRPVPIQVTRR
ncbi:MAG: penicillin-binding protein activator [Gemmatimonadetes bacterium]|nr:penicillin-binding protein activator [Gemmatimonadota bacterium]